MTALMVGKVGLVGNYLTAAMAWGKDVRGRVNLPAMCERALVEAMDPHTMTKIANELIQNYDIYERTGFPQSMSIPGRDVAHRIVEDVVRAGKLLELIAALVEVQENGMRGRAYTIPNLRMIIQEVSEKGFVYDPENKIFIENSSMRKTRNWGALREGEDYTIAFLRLDIVGNSQLVRRYPMAQIRKSYDDLRDITIRAAERRNGRIWQWEGDGGLAAFFFGNKHQAATLTAMEIVHELHIYNLTSCPLPAPLNIRIAVHSGSCEYSEHEETLRQNATLKTLTEIEESHTEPQTVTISSVVKVMLDALVSGQFSQLNTTTQGAYFGYALRWEP